MRGRNGGDVEGRTIESNSKKTHGRKEARVKRRARPNDSGSAAEIKKDSMRIIG